MLVSATISCDQLRSVLGIFTKSSPGYGNIAPVTLAGRLFCILFAIVSQRLRYRSYFTIIVIQRWRIVNLPLEYAILPALCLSQIHYFLPQLKMVYLPRKFQRKTILQSTRPGHTIQHDSRMNIIKGSQNTLYVVGLDGNKLNPMFIELG